MKAFTLAPAGSRFYERAILSGCASLRKVNTRIEFAPLPGFLRGQRGKRSGLFERFCWCPPGLSGWGSRYPKRAIKGPRSYRRERGWEWAGTTPLPKSRAPIDNAGQPVGVYRGRGQ